LNSVDLVSGGESIGPWVVRLGNDVQDEVDSGVSEAIQSAADLDSEGLEDSSNCGLIGLGDSSLLEDLNEGGIEELEFGLSNGHVSVNNGHVGDSSVGGESRVRASKGEAEEGDEVRSEGSQGGGVGQEVGGSWGSGSIEEGSCGSISSNELEEGAVDDGGNEGHVRDHEKIRISVADGESAVSLIADC
jgi:hypothetical protein